MTPEEKEHNHRVTLLLAILLVLGIAGLAFVIAMLAFLLVL
ncbi:MAG: hypothetical protein U9Q03_00925 [Patescibacteria group bacterium]|nr:hypothetical protein [Patescibacteria group bacterium]